MQLLWQQYRSVHPEGVWYSRLSALYRNWKTGVGMILGRDHAPGGKRFVDYKGLTVPVRGADTQRERRARFFVAVPRRSSSTHAEATWTQRLKNWTGSRRRAFEFLGTVPAIVVSDNLEGPVRKALRHDPDLNPAYRGVATHNEVIVLPARVRKPRDKWRVGACEQRVVGGRCGDCCTSRVTGWR